jgi:hypothetical protein
VFRSSGPGGQSVNTTDSGGADHPPADRHRRVDAGRAEPAAEPARALQVLRARLLEAAERERGRERSAERRAQVGGGGRGEKIRTYNFKENRFTDHRIGFTIYRLATCSPVTSTRSSARWPRTSGRANSPRPPDGAVGAITWRTLLAETTDRVGERPAARWMCEVASGADHIERCSTSRPPCGWWLTSTR